MKRIIALVIAVGLAALLFVAPSDVDLEWPDAAQPTAPAASDNDPTEIIPVPADAIPMRVESITDGDTLKLSTDQPGDLVTTTRPIAVRLIGIDTTRGKTMRCDTCGVRTHAWRPHRLSRPTP